MNSQDAERQEWERAIDLLGRGTRHGRLLEYIGSKYFQRQEDHLTEVDIAIQVFGRSASSFDPASDAVVRVEAHRLRKKLRDVYEKDRRTDGLQISLPAGTYVPKFTAGREQPAGAAEAVLTPAPSSTDTRVVDKPLRWRRIPKWTLFVSVILAAIVMVIVGVVRNDRSTGARTATPASLSAQDMPTSIDAGSEISDLHIMAGYSGSEVIDNSGVRWTPDHYFVNGGQWSKESGFVRGTSRPFLFSNWRTGEFGYNIPLARGRYELRLFFVSPNSPGNEKLAGFNVTLNGNPLLTAFDVSMSANGADVADEQVFRDITPGKDGFLRLWFSNQVGSPMLNALEVVPGVPGKLKPIRILTQPTSFVDHKGQRWRADDYFQNGFRSSERRKVNGTEDPELFGAERYGHFSYAIPVDRRGRYTVLLHFVEFYYGQQLQGKGGVGSRVFHVFCNGQTLLRNFDIFKEAGSLQVVTKSFANIEPSPQGKINLDFEPVVNNATISGIEILDDSN